MARRAPLVASGAVGKEELNHADATLAAARSALAAAQSAQAAREQQALRNQALTDGTRVEEHPNVQRAAARVREAYLGAAPQPSCARRWTATSPGAACSSASACRPARR